MKIIWLHSETREVPGAGIMIPGQEYDISEETAKALIDVGLASIPKSKKEKTLNVED